MVQSNTASKVIGDLTISLSKEKSSAASAFDRLVATLNFLGSAITDPSYGISSDRPDQSLPGSQPGADQSLPGSERPTDPNYDQNAPGRPSQGLPPTASTKPGSDASRPDQGLPHEKIGSFLKENADEIAKAVLKGTACDPAAAPKT